MTKKRKRRKKKNTQYNSKPFLELIKIMEETTKLISFGILHEQEAVPIPECKWNKTEEFRIQFKSN